MTGRGIQRIKSPHAVTSQSIHDALSQEHFHSRRPESPGGTVFPAAACCIINLSYLSYT